MKIIGKVLIVFLSVFAYAIACHAEESEDKDLYKFSKGKIVIANRGSGSISIIDTRTDTLVNTIPLPADGATPEPMYVVHTPKADRVFVGDRANSRVVAFDDDDFSVTGIVPTGNGVFHMWADPGDNQLWISNDIDNTMTVIDPVTLEVMATVPLPLDLINQGGKPHDVILDPSGDFAYVTMLGLSGVSDYVIKFSTETFQETARAEVGIDPHVSLTRRNKLLYVPTQNGNAVYVLKRKDLNLKTIIPVPGAHGAGMPRNGKTFYTTNLPGGGIDGLFAIDTKNNEVIGEAVDTPYPVPHNIALTQSGLKLYLTHSGATSDKVTVYRINRKTRLPEFKREITVGLNPFGLAFVR